MVLKINKIGKLFLLLNYGSVIKPKAPTKMNILDFHRIGPLGRLGLVVALSLYIYVNLYICPLKPVSLDWGPI